MSLFKARKWWSTSITGDENESFDRNSLLIARLNDSEHDNLVVGSHSGFLRVYKISTERLENGTLTDYKPNDLVLEKRLPYPILSLGLGKLVSGSQKYYIAVLHPLRVTVYSLQSQEGITDHGDQNNLVISYEHILPQSSYSMLLGPFGGVQGRDFLCIESLNGQLNFFEQESSGFKCSLPNFLIPAPLCYVMRTDSFVTVSSNWFVESYRYQNMSQSENSGKLIPTWSYNLGESVLSISSLPLTSTETVIVILGEKNLYTLTDLGKLKFMKKFDFVPMCVHAFVIGWYWEPDARLMVSVASNSGTFLLYENTTLKWSAQLLSIPVAMSKASLNGLSGALVTLSETGHLQCSYLGTEPELFSAPPLSLKAINYEEAKIELENLHAVIKSNADSADIMLINRSAEKELQIQIIVDSTLKPLNTNQQMGIYNEHENKSLNNTSRVIVKLKPNSTLEQLQISANVSRPLELTEYSKLYKNVSEEILFETFAFIEDVLDVFSIELKFVVSFMNAQGIPRVLVKSVDLPLNLIMKTGEPEKEAEFKVTLNISRPVTPLNQLFPEFSSSITIPTAVGFNFINRHDNSSVSILIGKNSQRYRLQADKIEDLSLLTKILCARLKNHFENDEEFKMICTSSLPIPQLINAIDKHFNCKNIVFAHKEKLAQLSAQYRLVQRRLLSKLKDKIPTPLSGLEKLLKESLNQISNSVKEFTKTKRDLLISQSKLNAILELIVVLLNHMSLQKNVLENVSAVFCTPVQDLEDQSWEDITDISVIYLLRTLTIKKSDTNNQININNQNLVKITDSNIQKFEQHICSLLDKVITEFIMENRNITSNDLEESSEFEIMGVLPDLKEEIEKMDEAEFDIPEGLKFAERKIEVFRSKPLLEMRNRIVGGNEDD